MRSPFELEQALVPSLSAQRRVGVIFGGVSAERDVSLRSGRAVLGALRATGEQVVGIELDAEQDPLLAIRRARIDVAFLALHGRLGEDGCIQGLLEWLRIPYTGSGVLASALAMDKLKAKELFRLHNVSTPPGYTLWPTQLDELASVHAAFGFPVVVKPRREGSSLGVSTAHNLAELERAARHAFSFDSCALVERQIEGQEVQVALLDGRVLGAIEVCPKRGLFDFLAKYEEGDTEFHLPARLSSARYRSVLDLAQRAARALETDGAVRVDLMVTPGQNEYVFEVNTLPGMTPTSLYPRIAEAAGYAFPELCRALVDGARLHTNSTLSAPAVQLGVTPAADYGVEPQRARTRSL